MRTVIAWLALGLLLLGKAHAEDIEWHSAQKQPEVSAEAKKASAQIDAAYRETAAKWLIDFQGDGFSIKYPKGWKVIDQVRMAQELAGALHKEEGIKMVRGDVLSNVTFADQESREVNISVINLGSALTDEESSTMVSGGTAERGLELMRKGFPDARILESGRSALGQQPAGRAVIDFNTPMGKRSSMIFSAARGKRLYTLTFVCAESEIADFNPLVKAIKQSFAFTE